MYISRIELTNWKNFADVAVDLQRRVFIVGNNGSGKSNLLDALRFLRDIAQSKGGGLQAAVEDRGGIKRIRSMFARKPLMKIAVETRATKKATNAEPDWRYELELKSEGRGLHRVYVGKEVVKKSGNTLLSRPDKDEQEDTEQLQQTALEQVSMNTEFRELRTFFERMLYFHIVPQLIRHGDQMQARALSNDPFGRDLINSIANMTPHRQTALLRRIERALIAVKPEFKQVKELELKIERDPKTDKQHLTFKYPNWRSRGILQNEEIFSDGELRLLGLIWALASSSSLIMMEEPELSFNDGIVCQLPLIFHHCLKGQSSKRGDQIILTTHSHALLSDEAIDGREILLLTTRQKEDGTVVELGTDREEIYQQLSSGISAANVVLRYTQSPANTAPALQNILDFSENQK